MLKNFRRYTMNNTYEIELWQAVENFKIVAKKLYPNVTEENDNGEWEYEIDEFYDMTSASIDVIKNLSVCDVNEQTIDCLLYAIARDEECEDLIYEILEYNEWFSELCKQSLQTNYLNAKLQFARQLKRYSGDHSTKELIFKFLSCDVEYIERTALESLANIYPEKAEEYAVNFWERKKYKSDEYQKMMAIYVLHKINSPKLEYYLRKSEELNYTYLNNEVKRIRQEVKDASQY